MVVICFLENESKGKGFYNKRTGKAVKVDPSMDYRVQNIQQTHS